MDICNFFSKLSKEIRKRLEISLFYQSLFSIKQILTYEIMKEIAKIDKEATISYFTSLSQQGWKRQKIASGESKTESMITVFLSRDMGDNLMNSHFITINKTNPF